MKLLTDKQSPNWETQRRERKGYSESDEYSTVGFTATDRNPRGRERPLSRPAREARPHALPGEPLSHEAHRRMEGQAHPHRLPQILRCRRRTRGRPPDQARQGPQEPQARRSSSARHALRPRPRVRRQERRRRGREQGLGGEVLRLAKVPCRENGRN